MQIRIIVPQILRIYPPNCKAQTLCIGTLARRTQDFCHAYIQLPRQPSCGLPSALALLPILLGALLIHAPNGWVFSNPNGGWEYPLFLAVMTLVHALLGDGPLALKTAGATS
jgi:hypothetical protein